MKKVTIKKLTLINFKGIKSLSIDFKPEGLSVFGDNETGKTTLIDSFLWNLFGKDSTDRKDFNVKTLDKNNQAIPKIDHEVTCILDIDGTILTLKRCLKEIWRKKRGSEETEFSGHETLFWADDVPLQAGEYTAKISSIIDENV